MLHSCRRQTRDVSHAQLDRARPRLTGVGMRGGGMALGVACAATAGCIAYVHWEQRREITRMQQSILHDAEREAFRRRVRAAADAPPRAPPRAHAGGGE